MGVTVSFSEKWKVKSEKWKIALTRFLNEEWRMKNMSYVSFNEEWRVKSEKWKVKSEKSRWRGWDFLFSEKWRVKSEKSRWRNS